MVLSGEQCKKKLAKLFSKQRLFANLFMQFLHAESLTVLHNKNVVLLHDKSLAQKSKLVYI
jgi:hypothetical protein